MATWPSVSPHRGANSAERGNSIGRDLVHASEGARAVPVGESGVAFARKDRPCCALQRVAAPPHLHYGHAERSLPVPVRASVRQGHGFFDCMYHRKADLPLCRSPSDRRESDSADNAASVCVLTPLQHTITATAEIGPVFFERRGYFYIWAGNKNYFLLESKTQTVILFSMGGGGGHGGGGGLSTFFLIIAVIGAMMFFVMFLTGQIQPYSPGPQYIL